MTRREAVAAEIVNLWPVPARTDDALVLQIADAVLRALDSQRDPDDLLDRMQALTDDLARARERSTSAMAARNVALAITHMEDAMMRVSPPGWYRPAGER